MINPFFFCLRQKRIPYTVYGRAGVSQWRKTSLARETPSHSKRKRAGRSVSWSQLFLFFPGLLLSQTKFNKRKKPNRRGRAFFFLFENMPKQVRQPIHNKSNLLPTSGERFFALPVPTIGVIISFLHIKCRPSKRYSFFKPIRIIFFIHFFLIEFMKSQAILAFSTFL